MRREPGWSTLCGLVFAGTLAAVGPWSASAQSSTVVLLQNPDWKRAVEKRRGAHCVRFEIADYDRYFDTMILVLDMAKRSLVSVTRVPQAVLYAAGTGYFASPQTTTQGVPYIGLWRVQEFSR